MNSSGNATRSAPSRCPSARAARTFSALPAMSPTVGLSCATAIARLSAGREFMAAPRMSISNETEALGERHQPGKARDDQREPNSGRADVLDAADLRIDLAVDAVGKLLDRRVQELHHHHEHDYANEQEALPGLRGHQKGDRH